MAFHAGGNTSCGRGMRNYHSTNSGLITIPTGLDYFMVPWPFALMHCWELLLTPHVTQTADFSHLASFS